MIEMMFAECIDGLIMGMEFERGTWVNKKRICLKNNVLTIFNCDYDPVPLSKEDLIKDDWRVVNA